MAGNDDNVSFRNDAGICFGDGFGIGGRAAIAGACARAGD
jgi:hypothetical protein